MTLLVRARFLLPLTGDAPNERIADGFVLSRGDVILETGGYTVEKGKRMLEENPSLVVVGKDDPNAIRIEGDPVPLLDGILMPGFVKAHGHVDESPMIGLFKETTLRAWLEKCVVPFNKMVKEEQDVILKLTEGVSPKLEVYRKGLLDDIFFGITSIQYHHCNYNKEHVPELVQAVIETGVKCIIAVGSQDRNYDSEILDIPYTKAIERLDRYYGMFMANDKQHGKYSRIEIIPGPDQDFSNSEEMLRAQVDWARKHNTLIHIHSSEERMATEWFIEKYGRTPVEHLKTSNVLGPNCNVAHQVHTSEHDLELLRSSGTGVVHNPLANTILADGMPRLLDMLHAGIPVAISTDGSGSADMQNMIAAIRLVAQYNRGHVMKPVFESAQLLSMGTRIPAQMLRLPTGQLKPGLKADWIVISCTTPNMVPTTVCNCMENIVWSATGSEISYVCSEGVLLRENHEFCNIPFDIPHVYRSVQRLAEHFVAKLGLIK